MGLAAHIAAKLSETAGIPAMAVCVEEWWHVHRFGHDAEHPIVFLLLPGPEYESAQAVADRTAQNRQLVVVASESDKEAHRLGTAVIPVANDLVPELARSLVDSVWTGLLAVELAKLLGTVPFFRF